VSFATPKMRLQRHSLGINKLIGEGMSHLYSLCMDKHEKCTNAHRYVAFNGFGI
jgi:hypothetical protein